MQESGLVALVRCFGGNSFYSRRGGSICFYIDFSRLQVLVLMIADCW